MIKLQTHCVILFGFRKGKTGNLCYQLRAISCFLINLLNTRDRKKPNLLLFWTVFGGRVGNQAKFCCVWLELHWCATSVLGSQVFRQALMESCGVTCHMSHSFFFTEWWSKSVEGLLSKGSTPPSLDHIFYSKCYNLNGTKFTMLAGETCSYLFALYPVECFWLICSWPHIWQWFVWPISSWLAGRSQ